MTKLAQKTVNPLHDRCACGSCQWRVTSSLTEPIVRCDACGRLVEPTACLEGSERGHVIGVANNTAGCLALIAHQLDGQADPGIVEDLGGLADRLATLAKGVIRASSKGKP